MAIRVTHLFEYPLKSSRGNLLSEGDLLFTGFKNDRRVAVTNENNKIITAREFPDLVKIHSEINADLLILKAPNITELRVKLNEDGPGLEATLFGLKVQGVVLNNEATQWISEVLKGNFRLLYRGTSADLASEDKNGTAVKGMGYPDSGPIHLINQKTLDALNFRLQKKVDIENFRPNIVVDGAAAFEEDHWSEISINGCNLRTRDRTERCVVTTIDPKTAVRDAEVEPLSTLSKLRRAERLPVSFGIDMGVLSEGRIQGGDEVVIK